MPRHYNDFDRQQLATSSFPASRARPPTCRACSLCRHDSAPGRASLSGVAFTSDAGDRPLHHLLQPFADGRHLRSVSHPQPPGICSDISRNAVGHFQEASSAMLLSLLKIVPAGYCPSPLCVTPYLDNLHAVAQRLDMLVGRSVLPWR